MGKYRMYEPYGYEDDSNCISKKDQIERELEINRTNDAKEFASVEYDKTIQAFVFRNVKGEAKGYAYMASIVPAELIKTVVYDADNEKLIITFSNEQVVEIPLNDLIDVTEAGDGLVNENGKFNIKLTEDCERFLGVDENGLKLSGVQDAINVERDRAISAETAEMNRAISAETSIAEALAAETISRADGDLKLSNTIGSGFTEAPTQTVTFLFRALSEKVQKEIDDRGTAVTNEAQLRAIGDGNLNTRITQEVGELNNTINGEKTRAEGAESNLQASIEAILSTIQTINGQIANLDDRVTALERQ